MTRKTRCFGLFVLVLLFAPFFIIPIFPFTAEDMEPVVLYDWRSDKPIKEVSHRRASQMSGWVRTRFDYEDKPVYLTTDYPWLNQFIDKKYYEEQDTPPSPTASRTPVPPDGLGIPIGFLNYTERGVNEYLGDGTWKYTSSIGETNTWNGTHWVRYIYNYAGRWAKIGKLKFTHGENGVISVEHESGGFMIDKLKWYAQYYWGGAWRNFTFDNYQYVGASKTSDNVSITQRWWSTNGELNVTYTYTFWHELKIRAKATNWATQTIPVRIIWAALGIKSAGIDYALIKDANGVSIGVQIGNQQQLFWLDVRETAPEIAVNTIVDKPNRRAAVVFGNQSSTLAQYETMDIDPVYTVAADGDDDCWEMWDVQHRSAFVHDLVFYTDWMGILIDDNAMFLRWSLAIPNAATILTATWSAYVEVSITQSHWIERIDEANVGDLEADGAPPAVTAVNRVSWQPAGAGAFKTSGSIVDMVQDQVNLGGWSSGDFFGLRYKTQTTDIGGGQIEDYQDATANHAYLTITHITNTAPVNDVAPSCTNLDDGDNLYARRVLYEFDVSVQDADGFPDIDYVELSCTNFVGGAVRWTVRFDEDTATFSEQAGATYIALDGTSSNTSAGINLDITFVLYINWAHPNAANDDLKQFVIDDEGGIGAGASDTDEYNVDYDYETRLDCSDFAVSDGSGTLNRGDISGAITFTGTVLYSGSALFPPNTAFTNVHIHYDPENTWLASDVGIVNGAFSIAYTAHAGVQTQNYKVHSNMGASGGGHEAMVSNPLIAYISDRVQVQSYSVSDSRDNVNDNVNIDVTLDYDFDNTDVTDGTVTINGFAAAHQGAGVWRITRTSAAVTSVTYNNVQVTGNTHGITVEDQNGQSTTVIWDRIEFYSQALDDSRVDINANIEYRVQARLDFDNHALGAADSLTANFGGVMAWDAGNSWFDVSHSEAAVVSRTFSVTAGSEVTHGITALFDGVADPAGVWDRIELWWSDDDSGDARVNLNLGVEFDWKIRYDFDNAVIGDGEASEVRIAWGSLTGPGWGHAAMSWDGGNAWWQYIDSDSVARGWEFFVYSITETQYGLTVTHNFKAFNRTCIWDQIIVYYQAVDDGRVDINTNIEFRAKGVLDYDEHPLGAADSLTANTGVMAWDAGNSWFDVSKSQAVPSDYTFNVSSGNEATHGITVATANVSDPTGIWDRIEVWWSSHADGSPDGSWARVGNNTNIELRFALRYEYDNANVTTGTVKINGSVWAWDAGNNWWDGNGNEATVGNYTYLLTWHSGDTHGITEFNNGTETTYAQWVVFDCVEVWWSGHGDATPDGSWSRAGINTNTELRFAIRYEFDSVNVTTGIVNINGTTFSWDAGNTWWDGDKTHGSIVNVSYIVTWGAGDTYNIIPFDNGTEITFIQYVIWDRVDVDVFALTYWKLPLGRNASGLIVTGAREFDGSAFDGTITLNDTDYAHSGAGYYGYQGQTITGGTYGITTFQTNATTVLWQDVTLTWSHYWTDYKAVAFAHIDLTDISWVTEGGWVPNLTPINLYENGTGPFWSDQTTSGAVTGIVEDYSPSWVNVNWTVEIDYLSAPYNFSDYVFYTTTVALPDIHTLYLDLWVLTIATDYIWVTYSTNWANTSIFLYWNNSYASETFAEDTNIKFTKNATAGLHQISFFINGSTDPIGVAASSKIRWVNTSYFVDALEIEDFWFGLDDIYWSAFIKPSVDGNYYVYENNTLRTSGSITDSGLSINWLRNLTAGLWIVGIKVNASSGTAWCNASYYSAFLILEEGTIMVGTTLVHAFFKTNLDCGYTVYENESSVSSGSISKEGTTFSWTLNTTIAVISVGIRFNLTGHTTLWYNTTYTNVVDVGSTTYLVGGSFVIDENFVYCIVESTQSYSYTVYENESSIDTGSIQVGGTTLSWSKNTSLGLIQVGVKVYNATNTWWINCSYTSSFYVEEFTYGYPGAMWLYPQTLIMFIDPSFACSYQIHYRTQGYPDWTGGATGTIAETGEIILWDISALVDDEYEFKVDLTYSGTNVTVGGTFDGPTSPAITNVFVEHFSFYLSDDYCNAYIIPGFDCLYQIYENESLIASGSLDGDGTSISWARNKTTGTFFVGVRVYDVGLGENWCNTTYSNAITQVLYVMDSAFTATDTRVYTFLVPSVLSNFWVYENNTYISQTGSLVLGGTSFDWARNTSVGLIEVGIKLNATGYTNVWFNTSYYNGVAIGGDCSIYFYDSRGEYAEFDRFKVYIDNTRIYSNTFWWSPLGGTKNITVYDKFDVQVYQTNDTSWARAKDIALNINILKILNLHEDYILLVVRSSGGAEYAEYLVDGEVWKYPLYQATYTIEVDLLAGGIANLTATVTMTGTECYIISGISLTNVRELVFDLIARQSTGSDRDQIAWVQWVQWASLFAILIAFALVIGLTIRFINKRFGELPSRLGFLPTEGGATQRRKPPETEKPRKMTPKEKRTQPLKRRKQKHSELAERFTRRKLR